MCHICVIYLCVRYFCTNVWCVCLCVIYVSNGCVYVYVSCICHLCHMCHICVVCVLYAICLCVCLCVISYMCHMCHVCVIYVSYVSYMCHICHTCHMCHICVICVIFAICLCVCLCVIYVSYVSYVSYAYAYVYVSYVCVICVICFICFICVIYVSYVSYGCQIFVCMSMCHICVKYLFVCLFVVCVMCLCVPYFCTGVQMFCLCLGGKRVFDVCMYVYQACICSEPWFWTESAQDYSRRIECMLMSWCGCSPFDWYNKEMLFTFKKIQAWKVLLGHLMWVYMGVRILGSNHKPFFPPKGTWLRWRTDSNWVWWEVGVKQRDCVCVVRVCVYCACVRMHVCVLSLAGKYVNMCIDT